MSATSFLSSTKKLAKVGSKFCLIGTAQTLNKLSYTSNFCQSDKILSNLVTLAVVQSCCHVANQSHRGAEETIRQRPFKGYYYQVAHNWVRSPVMD